MAVFKWNERSEEAAQLVSVDELTDEQIAQRAKVTRQTLSNWKANPEFAARVDQHIADCRARIRKRGIAVIENRVRALQDRWDRMHRVIAERAEAPEMQSVPGGKTGLMVRDIKSVGAGTAAKFVDVYEVDTGLLRELREHEQQAAKELGQWTEKREHTGEMKFHPITFDGGKDIGDDDGGTETASPKAPPALP